MVGAGRAAFFLKSGSVVALRCDSIEVRTADQHCPSGWLRRQRGLSALSVFFVKSLVKILLHNRGLGGSLRWAVVERPRLSDSGAKELDLYGCGGVRVKPSTYFSHCQSVATHTVQFISQFRVCVCTC